MSSSILHPVALLPIDGSTPIRANSTRSEQRPSLFNLWTRYQFNTGVLSIKAKVPPGTVHAMLGNKPIARDSAQKILTALSDLLHQEYTLQSLYVALIAQEEDVHEHAKKAPRDERFTKR